MTNPQQPMSTRWPLTPSSLMIFLQTGQYWHDGRPAGPGDQSESVDSRDNKKNADKSWIYTTYKGTGKNYIV